ncbi:hypothetical protein L228DRAFT_171339 [Xylona heveae TC161]|uniref:Uncharacterized protein n=1 Tax=Xylona heveae (strain CBS 132557 / TC161) TaxID=1328760 RepID=A0A165FU10_XYLHT|nr:hypothetical protein L228DRAFT_171339 [Xylona heveae TC161]KZF21379.1 hypothetical protein L228DRAFT_171339 [Xylona heveae TC161]
MAPPRKNIPELAHDPHDEAPYDLLDQLSPVGDWAEEMAEYPEDQRSPVTPSEHDGLETNDKGEEDDINGAGGAPDDDIPSRHVGRTRGKWDPIEYTAEDLHAWEKKCHNMSLPDEEVCICSHTMLSSITSPLPLFPLLHRPTMEKEHEIKSKTKLKKSYNPQPYPIPQ